MDSLFDLAEYWAAEPGFNVALLFHPTLSYPTQVFIDHPAWADEEQQYGVVRFVRR